LNPVNQTIVAKGSGNCMQASFASLFECSLDEAINPMSYSPAKWVIPFMEWVNSRGYEYEGTISAKENKKDTYAAIASMSAIDDCFYAAVPSKNNIGVGHAVIINRIGIVVHDPNPDKKYLGINVIESGDLVYWFLFESKI